MSFGSNLNIIFYSDLVVSKKCNVTNNLLSTPRQFPLGAGLIPIILYCAFPRYNVTDSHFLVLIRWAIKCSFTRNILFHTLHDCRIDTLAKKKMRLKTT